MRAFLHLLDDFKFFNATLSFEPHLFLNLAQLNFNFLQSLFLDITDGKLSEQTPVTKSDTNQKNIMKLLNNQHFDDSLLCYFNCHLYLRSSSPLEQSAVPSHTQRFGRHSPFLHVKLSLSHILELCIIRPARDTPILPSSLFIVAGGTYNEKIKQCTLPMDIRNYSIKLHIILCSKFYTSYIPSNTSRCIIGLETKSIKEPTD